jgi:hypothetical protein
LFQLAKNSDFSVNLQTLNAQCTRLIVQVTQNAVQNSIFIKKCVEKNLSKEKKFFEGK